MLRSVIAIVVAAVVAYWGLGRLSYDNNETLLSLAPECLSGFFTVAAREAGTEHSAAAKQALRDATRPCAKLSPMTKAFQQLTNDFLAKHPNDVAVLRDWLQRGGFDCEQNDWAVMCECKRPPSFVYYWPCTECEPMLIAGRKLPRTFIIHIYDYAKLGAAAGKPSTFKTRFEVILWYSSGRPDVVF